MDESSTSGETGTRNLIQFLRILGNALDDVNEPHLATALAEAARQATISPEFGGYGLADEYNLQLPELEEKQVIFLLSAYIEAMKCAERAQDAPTPLSYRPTGRRGMTVTEKILAMHDVSRKGWVQPGDVMQVDIDWVLASELSWMGMVRQYDAVGRPGIFRNDRFWLAGDHRVEPELYDHTAVRALMKNSERARDEFKMENFQGFNYTIMHTEFFRSRVMPGAASALAIGMGGADVCIPLITGQTWLTVPETVQIKIVGKPPQCIGGKDTILHILGKFKRNTIAANRVVEFTGPGLVHLSCDARFAIANMCTEFGAVSGLFEPDQQTLDFISRRPTRKYREGAVFFKADEDAQYAETFEIDLSDVKSSVALYPSPDNVVPVHETVGLELDGTFIGACTTAEEDLIIGAMVLQVGLRRGLVPINKGRRVVVPGSRPIRHKLAELGLLDAYRDAGFKVGVPGCSMCVGQGMDQAASGEVWLSSQNRNFKNRMGPGSIANLASAATVAASSFSMKIIDPHSFLEDIDMEKLRDYLGYIPLEITPDCQTQSQLQYSEPYSQSSNMEETRVAQEAVSLPHFGFQSVKTEAIKGRVLRLGDFVDTDAIIPSKFLATGKDMKQLGTHCMEFFMPEFREQVQSGKNIVVAGRGFGCGSSREQAVTALQGTGVQCVIAQSFAFIYGRNQPNLGLPGIIIQDEKFFQLAQSGEEVVVDMNKEVVA
ncbi:putative aconitate hydratase [Trichoderma asperellum]|uniref:Putative aconitate hydratase n=1 Tax=Trichoderma asperellum TaxID=101201 RepID=A0A6V8QPD8_TRIAP|nr:putative aconitate hydratase [Trichoderma asperellum]